MLTEVAGYAPVARVQPHLSRTVLRCDVLSMTLAPSLALPTVEGRRREPSPKVRSSTGACWRAWTIPRWGTRPPTCPVRSHVLRHELE